MHICAVINQKVQFSYTERNKYVFKWDVDDDSDGAYLTSFGIEFLTEEETKENIIIIMAIFKRYFCREHIALS